LVRRATRPETGTRDADADRIDGPGAGLVQKRRDNLIEVVEVEGRVLADDLRLRPFATLAKESDQGLGPADVRREEHEAQIIRAKYARIGC
jgi:hypothetical protein